MVDALELLRRMVKARDEACPCCPISEDYWEEAERLVAKASAEGVDDEGQTINLNISNDLQESQSDIVEVKVRTTDGRVVTYEVRRMK